MQKKILITGAGRGIGRTIALKLSENGFLVSGCARTLSDLEETKALSKDRISIAQVDVSDFSSIQKWIQSEDSQNSDSTLWGLVTAAGIYGPIGLFSENSWADWKKAIEINLMGTAMTTQIFTQHLLKKKLPGRIAVLSGGGATKPMPHFSSYAASKAAVVRFAETLAYELRDFNISVNSIAPGAINTQFLQEVLDAGAEKAGAKSYASAKKQFEAGGESPEKAANLVHFLMQPESGDITGRLISAIWDPWNTLHQKKDFLNNPELYTLRRMLPKEQK